MQTKQRKTGPEHSPGPGFRNRCAHVPARGKEALLPPAGRVLLLGKRFDLALDFLCDRVEAGRFQLADKLRHSLVRIIDQPG